MKLAEIIPKEVMNSDCWLHKDEEVVAFCNYHYTNNDPSKVYWVLTYDGSEFGYAWVGREMTNASWSKIIDREWIKLYLPRMNVVHQELYNLLIELMMVDSI